MWKRILWGRYVCVCLCVCCVFSRVSSVHHPSLTSKTAPYSYTSTYAYQVPQLSGNGVKLTQSMAIVEYLEDLAAARPEGCQRLFPTDANRKAIAREIAELVNSGIQPLQNLAVLRQVKTAQVVGTDTEVDGKAFATACMHKGLVKLEALVKAAQASGVGPYAAGTTGPTIADVCLVPQVYNAVRFGCDVGAEYPALAKVNSLCEQHPAFQAAHPDKQPDAK